MRSLARIILSLLAVLAMVIGAAAVGLGLWINATLDGRDLLRTEAQTIELPGCSTAIIEIADVRFDIGELADVPQLVQRVNTSVSLRVDGADARSWLVGVGDQKAVESRLLGARYCLAEFGDDGWASRAIAVEPEAPDALFDGVAGLWALVPNGQSVALPVPEAGSTIVVSGSDDSTLTEVTVVGDLRIDGASDTANVAVVGGFVTFVLGVALLVVSLVALRRRGNHEGRT